MPDHKYRITYLVEHHVDGLTADEVEAKYGESAVGACDNFMAFSVMGTPGGEGALSVLPVSQRGVDGEELSGQQQWMLWLMWATQLDKSSTLSKNKRELCAAVVETVRGAMGIVKHGDEDAGCVLEEDNGNK